MKGIKLAGDVKSVINALYAIKSQHNNVVDFVKKVDSLKVDTAYDYVGGLILENREVK